MSKNYYCGESATKQIANQIIRLTNSNETGGEWTANCSRNLSTDSDEITKIIKEKTGREVIVLMHKYQVPSRSSNSRCRKMSFGVEIKWNWLTHTDSCAGISNMPLGTKELLKAFLNSEEIKKQLKQCIIDHLKDEESDGYLKLDDFVNDSISDDDWKEIAKAVGDDITKVGEYVFTRSGIANCDFWKHFKP